ncbi:hypothetical protein NC651_020306 [Populus alba x Populus x berolinensis]|nr:hypothetical protein NC651_020306 [Populus alba x Populus x berolinensis]
MIPGWQQYPWLMMHWQAIVDPLNYQSKRAHWKFWVLRTNLDTIPPIPHLTIYSNRQ